MASDIMALHQFEALFALLLAPFQDIPDWIYLTDYTTQDITKAMELYLAHRQSEIAPGVPRNQQDFIKIAVYSEYGPTNEADREEWQKDLDVIVWLIHRMAREYHDRPAAYNSYKHGLRVMTGSTWFRLRVNDAAGNPTGSGFGRSSEDSLIYLEPQKEGDHYDVYETIQHFDPEEYYVYLGLMAAVSKTIKATRLAHFKKEKDPGPIIRFGQIDTDDLMRQYAGKHFHSSWTV